MKNKFLILTITVVIYTLTLNGCYRGNWRSVKWSDKRKKVLLDKGVYKPIVDKYGTYKFSYCEFYNLYSKIRSDSMLFEQMFISKNKNEIEGGFTGSIQRITKISSSHSETHFGWAYRKDSSFYEDVFRWGCKLKCIPCDSIFRKEFLTTLQRTDLSRDKAFVNRARIRQGKDSLPTLPADTNFHYLETIH